MSDSYRTEVVKTEVFLAADLTASEAKATGDISVRLWKTKTVIVVNDKGAGADPDDVLFQIFTRVKDGKLYAIMDPSAVSFNKAGLATFEHALEAIVVKVTPGTAKPERVVIQVNGARPATE